MFLQKLVDNKASKVVIRDYYLRILANLNYLVDFHRRLHHALTVSRIADSILDLSYYIQDIEAKIDARMNFMDSM